MKVKISPPFDRHDEKPLPQTEQGSHDRPSLSHPFAMEMGDGCDRVQSQSVRGSRESQPGKERGVSSRRRIMAHNNWGFVDGVIVVEEFVLSVTVWKSEVWGTPFRSPASSSPPSCVPVEHAWGKSARMGKGKVQNVVC